MIALCWQVWRHKREDCCGYAKGCHDVGLRKQHLGCHNSWDCWCFTLLVWFCVLHCVGVGSALLTVGGNWLPHTVTPLDVTTRYDAVDRPRTFYTLQNARQQHCIRHSDSGQQVSSLPDIAQEEITVYFLQISAINII